MSKKPPRRQQIRFEVRRLVDPETGEEVGALVPKWSVDRRTMKERGYHVGIELKADVRRSRNSQFYRLGHVLGGWLVDNCEGWEGLTQHDALKRLQERSGIGCITEAFEIPGFGRGHRIVAESLNFDDMDEGRWRELWNGWIEWMRTNLYGGMTAEQLAEVEALIDGEK